MLEVADREFKITLINILEHKGKVDHMKEQMGYVSRDMEIITKNQK